jgi:tetratricopeptide (TPR) repeat protein/TolB-like protein
VTEFAPDLARRLQLVLGPQYELGAELGRGGMGVVYRATDTALERVVAVKVIHPELASHEGLARRFLAEARTIARLRHPNIVSVHTAGTGENLLYYVMDDVPGETLRERLARERRLEPAEAARITADLAAALDAAGKAGVVHRDIKPENVLLDSHTGRAMLVDFGIARAIASDPTAATVTGAGVAVGTPIYMSPEQAAGEDVDTRSDIYSLGLVAYEMLAGAPPFEGSNRVVVSKHIGERPVPIRRIRPETPPALADAIMHALEKAPASRWQTGDEFRRAVLGEAATPARRRRNFLIAGVAASAVVVGAVALGARNEGPPAGVDPRHSILVLPFDNLRNDASVEWLRDGSVSMLALNLSQWEDLHVIDNERMHDLLRREGVDHGEIIGLEMARRLARDAGVWTVVLGEFDRAGDSLHVVARVFDVATGRRLETASIASLPGDGIRSAYDDLAARLLNLSGAPADIRTGIAQATTSSLEAFRAYLAGVDALNDWDLAAADRALQRAIEIDTTFGLAYYKYALTRGWLAGTNDSVSMRAMIRASAHAGRLPLHERTIITAYRALLENEHPEARRLYQDLIVRDSTDTDAWYGLGEAWFHDMAGDRPASLTEALRAFQHTLELDPDYALAYDHIEYMLAEASKSGGSLALVTADSFAPTRDRLGRSLLDSAGRTVAADRAQRAVVDLARAWVATQPTAARANGALVDAYIVAEQYPNALAEVARFRELAPGHPELPFVEARIHFAAGDVARAAGILRAALDSTSPEDFRSVEGTPTVLGDLGAAVNVFAYQGDLANAERAIELADQVRQTVYPALNAVAGGGDHWGRMALGQLYAATGAPAGSMRRVWQSAAEAARTAPPERRKPLVASGAAAAVGLFTGVEGDTSALVELRALTGEPPAREVEALLALRREDSAGARRALATPDTTMRKTPYVTYHRPLAARAYYLLGDYQTTLDLLSSFEPDVSASRGFDPRWGMVGQVRLLRAAAHAKMGHVREAREEYERVLAQWNSADPALEPYLREARLGLAALGEAVS